MSLTELAIEKSTVTIAVLILIVFAGYSAFTNLPQNEDPGFVIRTAVVQTFFPGASPERVEQLVTDKIEKVVQEIPELDTVRSESKTGSSLVWVDLRLEYTDIQPIWDDLRDKVDRARSELPREAIGPFVNDEFGDVFGIILTITGDEGISYRQLDEVAEEVRDEFLLLKDVAKVDVYGSQDERVFIEYDNARLAELGVSPVQLQRFLASRNIVTPGGSLETDFLDIAIEPSGNFESVDDLKRMVFQLPGSDAIVYLEDVADIYRGYIDPPSSITRCTEGRCLALAVSMREGGNVVKLGDDLIVLTERLQQFYPVGIEFDFAQFLPDAVQRKVDDFTGSLIQAVVIVGLVMLVVLGLRSGLIVASLVPMAILATFPIMSLLNLGLDQISLASLIIALGMLVDNATVVSESTMSGVSEGKDPKTAAIDSAKELKTPLLIASLTTAAAFLPIFLAESEAGEYTSPIFQVVSIALIASWLLSLTMIPVLLVRFLKTDSQKADEADALGSPWTLRYEKLLRWTLRNRLLTMAAVIGMFVAAIIGLGRVPNIFFPPNDRATLRLEIEMPAGSPIERTERAVQATEDFMRSELLAGNWDRVESVGWAGSIDG